MSWWVNLLLFMPGLPFAAASEPLALSETKGKAPLSVSISAPAELLARVKTCRRGIGGHGFYIDWGDGSSIGHDCSGALSHRFSVPGRYTVKAQLSHPGPTDAPIIDWKGEAVVEVSAGAGNAAPAIKLKNAKAIEPLHYGTGFPHLAYSVETSQAGELKAEIVKEGGKVLFSTTKPVSFSGDDKVFWSQYGNGPPAEEYKKGVMKAFVRLSLIAGGKVLAESRSEPFEIRASAVFRPFEQSEDPSTPRTVIIRAKIYHPECYSFIVDWGDGHQDRSEGFVPKKGCKVGSQQKELSHSYSMPGTYTVRWYDNNSDPFREARIAPGYMERQVKVK